MKKMFFKRKLKYKSLWRFISNIFRSYVKRDTVSLLIAILAAYISCQSLDESIKQRESMYKPELFVGFVDFYADIWNLNNIKYYYVGSDSVFRKS